MTDKFREKLGHLSAELDQRLSSPSPRRSPWPIKGDNLPSPTTQNDSRPNIAPWPAPSAVDMFATTERSSDSIEPPQQALLTMLKAVSASGAAPRGRETELKKKIQTLEDTVAEYERQKYNVMGTFSEYRERVAERERKLEAEYSSKIIVLSEEVLGAKKDFEARMKSFQALQDKFEREKEQALEKLRQEHQKEIQLMEQKFSESQLLNLEQKYMLEIQRLEEERKSLKSEKERLGETFEMKLRRAQSLYETELTAAKMLYSRELEALRDHEEALKDELLARQDEFHDRLQELQLHAKRSRDELSSCKNEVQALERKLHCKQEEVAAISKQVEEARSQNEANMRKLNAKEAKSSEMAEQLKEQANELKRKKDLLNVVEAAKEKLEAVIRDLQTEVKALKNKVEFLEKERDNLQSQSESQTQLQNSQVHALEAVLESVTKEKETTKEHYESLLAKEKQQSEAREHAMKKEFASKLNELEEQYASLKEDLEATAELERRGHKQATEQEVATLRAEKSLIEAQLAALEAKFLGDEDKMEDAVTEQLANIVRDSTSLRQQLDEYRQQLSDKEGELEELRAQLLQEHRVTEDQLMVIRDEVRIEVLESAEYRHGKRELEDMREKMNDYEMMREAEDDRAEEMAMQLEELKKDNRNLRDQVALLKNSDQLDELADQLEEKERLLQQYEQNESQRQADFDSAVDERVSVEIAKAEAEHKKTLKQHEAEWEDKNRALAETLSTVRAAGEVQVETLQHKVDDLLTEMSSIKLELEQKTDELASIEKKTEKSMRKRDAKNEDLEAQISEIKQRHEEEISALKSVEANLSVRISELSEQLKEKTNLIEKAAVKPEVSCSWMQTEEEETEEETEKESELSEQVRQLEQEVRQRDEQIERLQEQAELELECEPCEPKQTMFQSLVHTMTEKKDKKAEELAKSQKKEAEKKEKEQKEKAAKEEKAAREKEAKIAASSKEKEEKMNRSKSPSLLTRLRERSPAKRSNLETTPAGSRSLLSPMDAERLERKSSPSRQLFGRKKDSDKRPAWKF